MTGYLARIQGYFREMFPLPGRLTLAALTAVGISGYARAITATARPIWSWDVAGGVWNVFAVLLILRLMDELKDREIDQSLFPDRPLPSGRILESDIRLTLVGVTAAFVGANLWSWTTAIAAGIVLGYSSLMYVRFWAPELLKGSLPITLATHTPVVPLMLLLNFVQFAAACGIAVDGLPWRWVLPYVVMVWASVLAWELSRKIRAPEEETAYVTYSRILGFRIAVAAAAAAQTLALATGAYLHLRLSPGWCHALLMAGGYLYALWGHARFLTHPSPQTSGLKHYAERFLLCVLLAQACGFTWGRW